MLTPQPVPAPRATTPPPGTPLPTSTVAAWNLLASDLAQGLERGDPLARAVLHDLEQQLGTLVGVQVASGHGPAIPCRPRGSPREEDEDEPSFPRAREADPWPVAARRFATLHECALRLAQNGGPAAVYILAVEGVARLRTRSWVPPDVERPRGLQTEFPPAVPSPDQRSTSAATHGQARHD